MTGKVVDKKFSEMKKEIKKIYYPKHLDFTHHTFEDFCIRAIKIGGNFLPRTLIQDRMLIKFEQISLQDAYLRQDVY